MHNKSNKHFSYLSSDFNLNRRDQFSSIFYQAREAIINPKINSMLEFGIGRGSTLVLVKHFGVKHTGVDFNEELFKPDHVSTILNYEDNNKYDMVSAFQVLEHNPLFDLKDHLIKMKSLSNKYVFISVPYSGRWMSFNFNFNLFPSKFGSASKSIVFTFPRLFLKKKRPIEEYLKREDKYNPHWWEIGDKGFSKKDFSMLVDSIGLEINKSFHNEFFPYHLFYLLEIKPKKNE